MESRLTMITLGVADLERAAAFYEALGWERAVRDAKEARFFRAGPMALGLFGRDAMAEDAGVPAAGPEVAAGGFTGITLGQNQRSKADVDAVLAEAAAAGGDIVKPAQDAFWGGYHGFFRDPDGHVWEIAWNPFFPLAKDGAVTLPD